MQTVAREAFDECVLQLQQTVGVEETRPGIVTHSCVQGVLVPLEISSQVAFDPDPEEFCTGVKGAYIRNLFQISTNAMRELREIANTGKSDGLVQMANLLADSFKQRSKPSVEPEQWADGDEAGEDYDYE